ncbi:MAG: VWA domain-containing protein [Verrucomicrobiota bacterium]|nr:VWA domain-containing protein [Verrucomicrobiota bacterium]
MSFLNLLPVWGTLAAIGVAVPIIIHLLYRKNKKETDWAAMELLRRALVVRSGQIRLEDFIILLLRCLTLLLLAAALLRPILKDSSLVGDQRVGMVVAIDDSLSMNHGAGNTRFETAIEQARKVLGTASPGDKVSIVFLNEREIDDQKKVPLRAADFDAIKVNDALDTAKNSGASTHQSNLENSIPLLKEMSDEMKAGTKEIYIITDAQQSDWNGLSSEAKNMLGAIDASIYVLPVNSEGDENRSVTSLNYVSGSLNSSGVARFEATVKNFGTNAADAGNIEFYQNSNLVRRQTLGTIGSGESKVIPFLANYEKPGDLSITAKISKDSLGEDNSRHTVVNVRPRVRVLCATDSIDGGLGTQNNALFFLENALRLSSGDEENGIQVTSVDSSDLTLEKLNNYDIIILANVSAPSAAIADRLKKFTTDGGGLIVFAGENINPEKYEQSFGNGQDSILPGIIGQKTSSGEENQGQWSLAFPDSDHPLARVVKSMTEDVVNAAKVKSIISIEPLAGSQVILSLVENNAPILVSKTVGEGSVILCATSADRSWSELVVHPVYAIMIQQAATTMTSKPDSRLAKINKTKTISIAGTKPANAVLSKSKLSTDSDEVNEENKSSVQVSSLTNESFKAEIKAEHISESGIYQILGAQESVLGAIAANSEPLESDVRVVAPDVLKETVGAMPNVSILSESPEQEIQNARKGSDLTTLLLFSCILCFAVQSILAKIFTNKISKGETDIATSLQLSNVAAARRT